MAWTNPVTRATGYVVLAADWNNEHVNNLAYLHGDAGGVTINNALGAQGPLSSISTILSSGGLLGYNPGTGSSVTQATSRNTTVTCNSICGQITTSSASIAAGAFAQFNVNNTFATDHMYVGLHIINSPVTGGAMIPIVIGITGGFFVINYQNNAGAATTQPLIMTFMLFAGTIT